MNRTDVLIGVLLALGFGAVLWEASSFQYGTEFAPGPGFAPVWYAVIGLVLALSISAVAWRAWQARPEPPDDEDRLDRPGLFRVGTTLAALVALLVVVPWLGLLPALLVFLLFLTLVVQRLSVALSLGSSLVTVAFIYLVFVRFLGVPVPAGPLGF